MRLIKILLIPVLLAYLSVAAAYVAFQRQLIYHPKGLNSTTPGNYSVPYQTVSFTAPDGIVLTGWWVSHSKTTGKNSVLLYCHGNASCLSDLAEVSKIFHDFGFDALLFDYRCYGASGNGALSERALDADAQAAYQWLKEKGIQENLILIWGHSLGSSVAARLATQNHPAGLILEGAFPSMYSISRQRNPWLILPSFLIWDKFETGHYVQNRSCPLLELHAQKDTVIPIELGREVFKLAAEPKQWLEIKGINHNDFPSVAYQYRDAIQGFVRNCLKPRFSAQ